MAHALLSADLAWPVTDRAIRESVAPLRDRVAVSWASWSRRPVEHYLRVDWAPLQAQGIGVLPGIGASLWIYPIERRLLHQAQSAARTALPEAIEWLSKALNAGGPWQASRHSRDWALVLKDRSND